MWTAGRATGEGGPGEGAAGSDARGLWARGRAKNGEMARGSNQGLRTSGLHPRPLFGYRWYLVPPGMVGTEARQKGERVGRAAVPATGAALACGARARAHGCTAPGARK